MGNAVTIQFKRDPEIFDNIDAAKIALDKLINHRQGQPILVRYYKDEEKKTIIDTIDSCYWYKKWYRS